MAKIARIRDRKAPRFRWSKYRYSVICKELFNRYRESFPDSPIKDWKTFKSLVLEFHELLTDEVVENRDGAKLPGYMGVLGICSFKPKKLVPKNWLAIDATGQQLKSLNIHTNELVCKIIYSIYKAKYRGIGYHLWKFKGDRNFTTKVSRAFRANYNKYKRLGDQDVISKMFKDDYIRTRFEYKGNEQGSEHGQPDNGQVHI